MAWRPHGKAKVDPTSPRAFGVCDRDGMLHSLDDLVWQEYYRGPDLENVWLRVCKRCLDKPNVNVVPKILPPDPLPREQPRPENFTQEFQGISAAAAGKPPAKFIPEIME